MAFPTFRGLTLENGCIEPWTGIIRDVQRTNVPGFNGTLIKHMGERRREFTVRGIFTSVDAAAFFKLKELEKRNDTKIGELVFLGLSYENVRITNIQYTRAYKNAVTDGIDVQYEVRFEQLSDSGTITTPDIGP